MIKEFFDQNKRAANIIITLAAIISIFFAVKIASEIRAYRFIGQGIAPTNTISFEGRGEVFAIPDIAGITFSVISEGKTVDEAQKGTTEKINESLDFLKASGIEDKDIKTLSYNSYPKYDVQILPPCYAGNCPPVNPKIIGYEVSQTIAVKIRNTDDTGKILEGLGKIEVSNMSGPDFTIEDQDALQAEARKKAIDDAKQKAEILSRDLGVRLLRIVGFNESGNYPIFYSKDMMAVSSEAQAPAPQLPKGENKIVSNVTITYEIR